MSSAPSNPLLSLLPQLNAAAQDISAQLQQAQSDLATAKQHLASAQVAAAQQAQIAVGPTYVQPADLQKTFNSIGQDGLDLEMGEGHFTLTTSALKHSNIKLAGRGEGKTFLTLNALPGAYSGIFIDATASNFEAGNFTLVGGTAKAFTSIVPFTYLHDINSIDDPQGNHLFWFLDLEQNSDNFRVANISLGITNDKGIYITSSNGTVTNFKQLGSVGEHCIRIDINMTTKLRPQNISLSGLDLTNHNVYGKETLAVRECFGVSIDNVISDGWIRIGQGGDTPDALVHVTDAMARGIIFKTLRPGGSLLQIEHDVWMSAVNVAGPGSLIDPLASVDDRAILNYREFMLTGTPSAGQAWHPMISGNGKAVAA